MHLLHEHMSANMSQCEAASRWKTGLRDSGHLRTLPSSLEDGLLEPRWSAACWLQTGDPAAPAVWRRTLVVFTLYWCNSAGASSSSRLALQPDTKWATSGSYAPTPSPVTLECPPRSLLTEGKLLFIHLFISCYYTHLRREKIQFIN